MSVSTHRFVCRECERESDTVGRLLETEWEVTPFGVRVGMGARIHQGVCPDCQSGSDAADNRESGSEAGQEREASGGEEYERVSVLLG